MVWARRAALVSRSLEIGIQSPPQLDHRPVRVVDQPTGDDQPTGEKEAADEGPDNGPTPANVPALQEQERSPFVVTVEGPPESRSLYCSTHAVEWANDEEQESLSTCPTVRARYSSNRASRHPPSSTKASGHRAIFSPDSHSPGPGSTTSVTS
jgi:hypothetical protein